MQPVLVTRRRLSYVFPRGLQVLGLQRARRHGLRLQHGSAPLCRREPLTLGGRAVEGPQQEGVPARGAEAHAVADGGHGGGAFRLT